MVLFYNNYIKGSAFIVGISGGIFISEASGLMYLRVNLVFLTVFQKKKRKQREI